MASRAEMSAWLLLGFSLATTNLLSRSARRSQRRQLLRDGQLPLHLYEHIAIARNASCYAVRRASCITM